MKNSGWIALFTFAAFFLMLGCGGDKGAESTPGTATISFRSDPAEFPVTVFVDGEELGTTPCSYKGDVGEEAHTLSAQAFGETQAFEAFKIKGSTDVVFSPAQFGLWLATGQVRDLDNEPLEGVKIEAMNNSTAIASTLTQSNGSFELYILKDFTSSLRFSRDEYETQTILILEIPETGADIRLAKIVPTILAITSNPSGAEVWVKGENLGTTPLLLTDLAPGDYEITLKLEGYEDWTQTAVVRVAETTEVTGELVALPNLFEGFVNGREWLFKMSNGGGGKILIDVNGDELVITVTDVNNYKVVGRVLNPYTGEVEFKMGASTFTGNFDPKTQTWSGTETTGEVTWTMTLSH